MVLPRRLPASAGRFVYRRGRVTFEPAAGAGVTLNGKPVDKAIDLRSDGDNGGPDRLSIGEVSFWVHTSGDRRAIRIHDPQSDIAKAFAGYRWFPIDEQYRVVGRFVKDASPRELKIPTLVGDYDVYRTEGVVEFTLLGQAIRMRPMTTRPGRLYFIFRDGTSGKETYEAARFLYTDLQCRRNDGARLQRGLQSALLIQPVHDVPDSARREPAERAHPRRRARLRGSAAEAMTVAGQQRQSRLMRLFLVHHGDAVGPEVDPRRPLSPAGRDAVERLAAAAASKGAEPSVVWHSGKLRAKQTAEIFWRACNALADFSAARAIYSPMTRPRGCAIACGMSRAT